MRSHRKSSYFNGLRAAKKTESGQDVVKSASVVGVATEFRQVLLTRFPALCENAFVLIVQSWNRNLGIAKEILD